MGSLLVPKLCLGTHGCEALLRATPMRRMGTGWGLKHHRKQSFQAVRSQAELGNERQTSLARRAGMAISLDNLSRHDNVLAALDRCDPCLGDHDAIDARDGRPGVLVDVIEVVQQSDNFAAAHALAALD